MENQVISIEQAIEMHQTYQNHIGNLISKANSVRLGEEYHATQFVWMSLDNLKAYVNHLDEVQKLNNTKITGIRFYLGAYPDQNTCDKMEFKTETPHRETMFLVPTMKVEGNDLSAKFTNFENVPFCISPTSSNPLEGDFEPIAHLMTKTDCGEPLATSDYTKKTSLIANKMPPTPPPAL